LKASRDPRLLLTHSSEPPLLGGIPCRAEEKMRLSAIVEDFGEELLDVLELDEDDIVENVAPSPQTRRHAEMFRNVGDMMMMVGERGEEEAEVVDGKRKDKGKKKKKSKKGERYYFFHPMCCFLDFPMRPPFACLAFTHKHKHARTH
jgi:hypothetical protein